MTMSPFAPGATAAVGFFAGLAFGVAYFVLLRQTVELYAAGHGRLVPAVLTLGRLAAAALFLAGAASIGALPLLASFIGFLLARAVALRGM